MSTSHCYTFESYIFPVHLCTTCHSEAIHQEIGDHMFGIWIYAMRMQESSKCTLTKCLFNMDNTFLTKDLFPII